MFTRIPRRSSAAPAPGAHLVIALTIVLGVVTGSVSAQQLEYRYREAFKNATSYVEEVEGNLEHVTQQVNAAAAADAPQVQANIDALNKRLKYAADHMAKLPADHPDVKALADRAKEASAAVERLQATLSNRKAGTQGAVDAQAAAFDADVDKLKEWGKAFSDAPNLFLQRPDDALALLTTLDKVDAEWAAIQQRWPTLLDTRNHEANARAIQAAGDFFQRSYPAFKQHMQVLRERLPGELDQHFTMIDTWIRGAMADKNPLLITNGVSQQLEMIEGKVAVLKGLDAAAAKTYEQRRDAARDNAKKAEAALRESIIQSNQPPQEQYAGNDVESLRELVRAEWKKLHPNDEPLAIVFNTSGWNRLTRWQWSDSVFGWEKVDYSRIQPKVVVKHDDRLAVIVPVDMYKDHLKGDQLAMKPWEKDAEPALQNVVLLERVRR